MTTRHRITATLSLALAAASAGCSKPQGTEPTATATAEPTKPAFGVLSMADFDARVADAKAGKGKLAIFDNNQHERYLKSHIPGAKWVDFKNITAADLPEDKETALVFYCSNEA